MKQYVFNQDYLESLLAYLAQRPYAEVYKFVSVIQSAPEGTATVSAAAPVLAAVPEVESGASNS